jgi:CheY-like chemotaxis protein
MDHVPEGGVVQKNLHEILKAANRAKDLVQQILTFSRQSEHERKFIKIQPLIKEVLKLLRSSIPTTIKISQNIDKECGAILADLTQIYQVLMNLCTNAYHAMREKGGVLEVTLLEEEIGPDDSKSNMDLLPGTYLRLTVSDTGHGMDHAVMEKIFNPYFTTKPFGEGTGMGLAISHGIVKSCGGGIQVCSEPGEGTTFHVYLPRIEESSYPQQSISTEPIRKGNERILLVDDEDQIVRMVQETLKGLGYHVTPRTSSIEALEAFRAQPDKFDLVITDMTMPNMTGAELAPKLLDIRPDIPIILCTGFSEVINEEKAKAMGIREYILKPIVRDVIAGTIRKVLDE